MGQETTTGELEIAGFTPQAPSKFFDDDGRLKRTGTVWTTSAHIITAVIGSGVLSLAWATAQLGWVAGPTVLFLFSFVTYYASCLLSASYRCGDPVTGKRNYTYMEAVQNILGGIQVKICGIIQYTNLVGVAIGYTIAASISMIAIKKSSCFHENGHDNPCRVSGTPYILLFENGKIKGSLTGISIGKVTRTQKIWRCSQALGAIAFAYSYSLVLIEIQDTIKSPPAEHKTMKKATLISVVTTTVFYMFCGCFGYAGFGDMAPGNLLTGFGFYNPYWLIDIANGAIIIHLVGAYQVCCQPLFAFVENTVAKYFPESKFIKNNVEIPIPFGGYKPYKLNMFRLVWRTAFVCMTTIVAMLMPFFNDVVGIIGAFGFWPLTVYFPVKMYIVQKKIPKWSTQWILLQILSVVCLIISIFAAVGSFAGVVIDLKVYKPFKTMY
ncbi:amino acid permease 2 [Artemisia annua]|uniref:Amino acid permease 2 n=1 Tax=Artemisia annua TaxID=35608 RepID=A0A2U1MZZ5_ARTAN|nr:amino acid permease 2 [Artemisia annua]